MTWVQRQHLQRLCDLMLAAGLAAICAAACGIPQPELRCCLVPGVLLGAGCTAWCRVYCLLPGVLGMPGLVHSSLLGLSSQAWYSSGIEAGQLHSSVLPCCLPLCACCLQECMVLHA